MASFTQQLTPRVSYDPKVPVAQGSTDLAARLGALTSTTDAVYDALIQSGKQADAWALADAMERFNRVGSELGVNQFARINALKELEAKLGAAAAKTNSQILMDKASAQAGIIGQLANMRQQDFQNAMTTHNATFSQTQILKDRAQQQAATQNAQSLAASAFNQRPLQTAQPVGQPATPTSAFTAQRPIQSAPQPVQQPSGDMSWELANKQALATGGMVTQTPAGLWRVLKPKQALVPTPPRTMTGQTVKKPTTSVDYGGEMEI